MTDQELNEAVARKLGAKRLVPGDHDCGDHYHDHWELTHEWNYRKFSKFLPDYCHSIAPAWEIIDHCERSLVLYQIDLSHSRTGSAWYCTLGTKNQYNEGVGANTAPMAICLAFLKLP